MAATPDHFRAFVEAVVASLDAPARTAHVAARLHISRSQLDRVVSAAAGEAPAQLQRRILLERAAFRLLERDLRVLEVAIEAGYASHEAFTRAFRRAYGSTPSAWRSASGPIHLDAPNRIHFHPPGGLRLPAQSEVTSVDLILSMTEHHIWLVGQLLERAAQLDDAQLDSPIELSVEGIDDNPTLRTVLSRLVDQMEIWNAAVANQPYDFAVKRAESLNSMRDRLAGAGPVFLGHVRSAGTKGQFDDTFVDSTSGTLLFFTYGGMIAHVLTYAAHRRTLATGALYAAGITDLEDDPLAWEPVRPVGRPTSP
jgi:AraC family transcriptional regulator